MQHRRNNQQWFELFTKQQQSGLSIAQFCRDNNINPRHFYSRRSQLKQQAPSTFVRATVAAPSVPDHGIGGDVVLHYGRGQLRLSAHVPAVWLAELMSALV